MRYAGCSRTRLILLVIKQICVQGCSWLIQQFLRLELLYDGEILRVQSILNDTRSSGVEDFSLSCGFSLTQVGLSSIVLIKFKIVFL